MQKQQFEYNFKGQKCGKMLSLSLKSRVHIIENLADKLLQAQEWQLLNKETGRYFFKNMKTNKIFQIMEFYSNPYDIIVNPETQNSQSQMKDNSNVDSKIFLQLKKVSDFCYLYERSVCSLKQKVFTARISGHYYFTEEQIINTLMPILKALAQNQIPSFYRITSSKIVLDSHQNIRLQNLENHRLCEQTQQDNFNLYEQLAVVFVETALLLSHESAIKIIKNQQKIIKTLLQRSFSYKIIGIIIILLNQQNKTLPINLSAAVNYQFTNQWFFQLKASIDKSRQKMQIKKVEGINTLNKTVLKVVHRNQVRCEDQTQDSQNQTLAKYRSGKRIENYNKNQQESNGCKDLLDMLLKPRKDRLKPSFN